STGLAYPPANAAPTEEVIALCHDAAAAGALHTTHMRDETAGVVGSVEETIRIARETGVRTVISHHKCCGRENAGLVAETLPRIEAARRDLALDLDVYPYAASSTALLPDFIARSRRVQITWSDGDPDAAGRDLGELMAERGWSVADALRELAPAGAVYFQMEEDDVERVLAFPPALVGSDGLPHDKRPHPRLWGTFPRVLGHYVRERRLFGLETAVHKMTGATARVFGLADRGTIRPGAAADLVLFDPETVADTATYDHPARPATGIETVWVAGRPVWTDSGATGERPGRFLARG
ncbi:MAG: amidohydrolase family protein, partial [Alphaproteobacteria bacterium]|nr:amidohydrolase family protein [Alphaproteobacteria bacterium]